MAMMETLAIVFGRERFHQHLYGKHLTVESDHLLLESIKSKQIL